MVYYYFPIPCFILYKAPTLYTCLGIEWCVEHAYIKLTRALERPRGAGRDFTDCATTCSVAATRSCPAHQQQRSCLLARRGRESHRLEQRCALDGYHQKRGLGKDLGFRVALQGHPSSRPSQAPLMIRSHPSSRPSKVPLRSLAGSHRHRSFVGGVIERRKWWATQPLAATAAAVASASKPWSKLLPLHLQAAAVLLPTAAGAARLGATRPNVRALVDSVLLSPVQSPKGCGASRPGWSPRPWGWADHRERTSSGRRQE